MKAFVSFFARKKSFVTTYQPLAPFVRIYATGFPVAFLFVYALKFKRIEPHLSDYMGKVWVMRELRREDGKARERFEEFYAEKDSSYIGYFKDEEFITEEISRKVSSSNIR